MSQPAVAIILKRAVFGIYRAKRGDTVMRPADEAAKLVKLGVATYATPPAPATGGTANGQ